MAHVHDARHERHGAATSMNSNVSEKDVSSADDVLLYWPAIETRLLESNRNGIIPRALMGHTRR